MNRRRVAIIGCGYVGSRLGAALVSAGHDVIGTTTSEARFGELRELGIQPRVASTTDAGTLADALKDRDVVYLTVAAGREHQNYRDVYLAGVANVLAVCDPAVTGRIIYTSSTSVYGQQDGEWVDEVSPTAPTSENGNILVEAERTLLEGASAKGIAATLVRLAGIYGPGRGPANRIPQRAGATRDDGDVFVNLIHVDDIVAVLHCLIDVEHHGVLNLADDEPIRRRELYDRIIGRMGLQPISWQTGGESPKQGKRVSNRLVKEVLGLALKHPSALNSPEYAV